MNRLGSARGVCAVNEPPPLPPGEQEAGPGPYRASLSQMLFGWSATLSVRQSPLLSQHSPTHLPLSAIPTSITTRSRQRDDMKKWPFVAVDDNSKDTRCCWRSGEYLWCPRAKFWSTLGREWCASEDGGSRPLPRVASARPPQRRPPPRSVGVLRQHPGAVRLARYLLSSLSGYEHIIIVIKTEDVRDRHVVQKLVLTVLVDCVVRHVAQEAGQAHSTPGGRRCSSGTHGTDTR